MDIKELEKLISEANSYDHGGNYKKADQIDQIIRLATGEKHTDSAGVSWINIGTTQDFGVMGNGFVWERQDTKGRQIQQQGFTPDSVSKPITKTPDVTVSEPEKPKETGGLYDSLYKALLPQS